MTESINQTPEPLDGISRRKLLKGLGMTVGAGAAAPFILSACSTDPSVATSVAAAASATTNTQAASNGAKTGRSVRFVSHSVDPFFTPVIAAMEEFAGLRGWDVSFQAPQSADVAETVNLGENAIAANPDAIAMTRIDDVSFDDNIRRALDQGIKVILFNTASEGYRELGVAYVGQEFVPAGVINGLQAAHYAQEVTGRTDGLIVLGILQPGHSALEQRNEGAAQGVQQYNEENGTNFETEVLATSPDQAEAVSRIDAKWTADGDSIVAFAHSEWVSWYTAVWAADRGVAGQFANGGFDLVPGVIEGIQDGSIHWSIGQNPYAQGWITCALLDMEMEAGFPANDYDTGAEIVDASNIEAVAEREARYAE